MVVRIDLMVAIYVIVKQKMKGIELFDNYTFAVFSFSVMNSLSSIISSISY